jgi:hypothetical protein
VAPYPVHKSFAWSPGVVDGQSTARPVLHMCDPCHRPPAQGRRNDGPDEEGRESLRHDWHCNINARRRPIDDLPRAGANGARHRTRSPPRGRGDDGERRQAQEAEETSPASRGRTTSRFPVVSRTRQPQRRDDEGWERRRSASPRPRLPARNPGHVAEHPKVVAPVSSMPLQKLPTKKHPDRVAPGSGIPLQKLVAATQAKPSQDSTQTPFWTTVPCCA